MDLAQGHIQAIEALDRDDIFENNTTTFGSTFGGSGGKYKAYNVSKI